VADAGQAGIGGERFWVRQQGKRVGMKIFTKRNALVGSMALFVGRRYARRRMRGMTGRVRPGR
jgi:hypothetical protein